MRSGPGWRFLFKGGVMILCESDLQQFSGSEQWYKHNLTPFIYTDGVKFMAERGQAYWLIDKILITIAHTPKLLREKFLVWNLTVGQDKTALLTCDDGNFRQGSDYMHSEKIDYTDFPLSELKLYFADGTLLLPSEY
jgi:hypothetical protein